MARIELVEALGEDGQICLGLCLVEAHEHVTGVDALVITYVKLADDAPGRMLHLLHVGFDHDDASGDHSAGKLGGASPAGDTRDQSPRDDRADQEVTADGLAVDL